MPHYRRPVFDGLATRGVTCLVITAGALAEGFIVPHDVSPTFHSRRLSRRIPSLRDDVVRAVREFEPDAILLEHGASLDFTWTVLTSSRLRGIPRILWTHGIERHEYYTKQHSIGSWGRWRQLALSDAIITYDDVIVESLRPRFPDKVIGVAPNSTDGRGISEARGRLLRERREAVKARLGLPQPHYLLALGRLVREKEFHRVVEILKGVHDAGIRAGAVFVGAGPETERIRRAGRKAGLVEREDFILTGPIGDPARLAELMVCADLCVQPGYLGLSVVDCLFGGVPTLAALPGPRGPFHSPEWRHLQPGITGFLVPENTDRAFAEEAIRYLSLPEEDRRSHEAACVQYAQNNLGIEPMVDGMLSVIRAVCR